MADYPPGYDPSQANYITAEQQAWGAYFTILALAGIVGGFYCWEMLAADSALVQRQINAGVVVQGPGKYLINGKYFAADSYEEAIVYAEIQLAGGRPTVEQVLRLQQLEQAAGYVWWEGLGAFAVLIDFDVEDFDLDDWEDFDDFIEDDFEFVDCFTDVYGDTYCEV